MSKSILTQARLQELLQYESSTGIFTRLTSTSTRPRVGYVAGSTDTHGYRQITIDGKRYLAHRLAWLYVHGVWPTNQIDHKNGITGDNSIDNLREATQTQNQANRTARVDNTSGLKGVSWHKQHKKWHATTRIQGKQKHLGYFDTKEEAHTAYCAATAKYFGEFANFG
jgi:hypothetical protein